VGWGKTGKKDLTKRTLEKCFYSVRETEAQVGVRSSKSGPNAEGSEVPWVLYTGGNRDLIRSGCKRNIPNL
jgi:hypothetical protein